MEPAVDGGDRMGVAIQKYEKKINQQKSKITLSKEITFSDEEKWLDYLLTARSSFFRPSLPPFS